MITEAIWEDKKWTKGSSRSDIRKFIVQNYDVDEEKLKENMSSALNKMLQTDAKTGHPCLTKVDDLGTYKITPEWRKEWKKKAGIRPQKRKKKKKDKDEPKHPRNSYLWYLQDVRETFKEKHPNKDHREITVMVAEEWKKLPSKKKKKYEIQAEEDKERYKKEMKAYQRKKKRERRDTSEESSSESRSKSKSKTKKRRYDSDSESKSDPKRRRKGSDSDSSDDKKKKRLKKKKRR